MIVFRAARYAIEGGMKAVTALLYFLLSNQGYWFAQQEGASKSRPPPETSPPVHTWPGNSCSTASGWPRAAPSR